jgi:hypothetical protein
MCHFVFVPTCTAKAYYLLPHAAVYAYFLLPHAQCPLTIGYRMIRVHTKILPFQLNQVKTYEKSGPQSNLRQHFFVLTQSQKSLSAYPVHCALRLTKSVPFILLVLVAVYIEKQF